MLMLNQADNVDKMVHASYTSYKRVTMAEIIMILVMIIFIYTARIGGPVNMWYMQNKSRKRIFNFKHVN